MSDAPGLPDLRFAGVDAAALRLEGPRLSYMEAGDGAAPALVLCHGIGSNSMGWRHVLAHFAPTRRVIAWNAPGYLMSDNLVTYAPSPEDYAKALAALVDTLGLKTFDLVGSSFGSMCASAFTIANPGRVRRLVLLGATRGLKNLPAEQRIAMLRMREESITQGPIVFGDSRWKLLLSDNASATAVAQVKNLLKATNRRSLLQSSQAIQQTDQVEWAPKITVPTLMATGSADKVTPVEANAALIVKGLPNGRLVVIDGVGHLPKVEAPEKCCALIADHLA